MSASADRRSSLSARFMPEEYIPLSSLIRHYEFEVAVEALARQYYEEEGRPAGRALDHWVRAENEVRRRHAVAGEEPTDS